MGRLQKDRSLTWSPPSDGHAVLAFKMIKDTLISKAYNFTLTRPKYLTKGETVTEITRPPTNEEINNLVDSFVATMGDKWSLHLIGKMAFGKSPIRFNELMHALKPISSRTLSAKLAKLTENEIIKKEIKPASPPYTIYSLTDKGLDLVIAFEEIAKWYLKWQSQPVKSCPNKNAIGLRRP